MLVRKDVTRILSTTNLLHSIRIGLTTGAFRKVGGGRRCLPPRGVYQSANRKLDKKLDKVSKCHSHLIHRIVVTG